MREVVTGEVTGDGGVLGGFVVVDNLLLSVNDRVMGHDGQMYPFHSQ